MMKLFLALAATSLAAGSALAQMPMKGMAAPHMAMPKMGEPALPTDQFLKEAAQSDEFEIQEGMAAQQMAHDPRLKSFAAQMIRDHTKSTGIIKAAVMKAGMHVPSPPPLKPEQQKMISSTQGMANMGGFDADYVNDQVMAHRAALALMTNYSKTGSSRQIREAAAEIVPVVRGHLTMIEGIQKGMPKGHTM